MYIDMQEETAAAARSQLSARVLLHLSGTTAHWGL